MNKGYTLIEVLISSSLLVIIALSFFYVSKTSIKAQAAAEKKLRSAYEMQAKYEEWVHAN